MLNIKLKKSKLELVFVHIPKTAGTSIRSVVDVKYDNNETAPVELYYDLQMIDPNNYKYIRGHFCYQDLIINNKPMFISVIRDPIDRIISLYEYWKVCNYSSSKEDDPNYDGVLLAKTTTFSSFIRTKNPSIRREIENAQYRYLIHSFNEAIPMSVNTEKAIKDIKQIYAWIGTDQTLEKDYESLKMMLELDDDLPRLNIGKSRQTINNDDRDYLFKINTIDYIIYNNLLTVKP